MTRGGGYFFALKHSNSKYSEILDLYIAKEHLNLIFPREKASLHQQIYSNFSNFRRLADSLIRKYWLTQIVIVNGYNKHQNAFSFSLVEVNQAILAWSF